MKDAQWVNLWKAHGNLKQFNNKLLKTQKIIEHFFEIIKKEKIYIAWSSGKDSTVLLHLALQYYKSISIMSQNDNIDSKEIKEYRNNIIQLFNIQIDEISPQYDILGFIKKYNIDITEDLTGKEAILSDNIFYKPIEGYRIKNQFQGYLVGLRRYESKAREKNFIQRGHIYQKNNQVWVCQPLAEWTARDIFAYLIKYNIPVNPIYFYTKFKKSPEHIRSNFLLPGSFSNKGEALWLKYYFPGLFNKLIEVCPKILEYV